MNARRPLCISPLMLAIHRASTGRSRPRSVRRWTCTRTQLLRVVAPSLRELSMYDKVHLLKTLARSSISPCQVSRGLDVFPRAASTASLRVYARPSPFASPRSGWLLAVLASVHRGRRVRDHERVRVRDFLAPSTRRLSIKDQVRSLKMLPRREDVQGTCRAL